MMNLYTTPNKPKLITWYSAILFIAFTLVSSYIYIEQLNQEVFLYINSYHSLIPNEVWEYTNMITYSKYFIIPATLILITAIGKRENLINVLVLIAIYFVLFMALKHIFHEARPYVTLPTGSFYWSNQFEDTTKSAYLSFPSGHTGNIAIFAFAMNIMFFSKSKIMQFIMLLLIIFIGLARICTGWHWPLDVLASGLIGYILTKIIFAINFEKMTRKKNAYY
ncbi:MAG: phosphatase PAP2 family protein [Burkholderiales bacterium]|nr:phosphatase PAP2 family protein [Burkholderiales bacterium]